MGWRAAWWSMAALGSGWMVAHTQPTVLSLRWDAIMSKTLSMSITLHLFFPFTFRSPSLPCPPSFPPFPIPYPPSAPPQPPTYHNTTPHHTNQGKENKREKTLQQKQDEVTAPSICASSPRDILSEIKPLTAPGARYQGSLTPCPVCWTWAIRFTLYILVGLVGGGWTDGF